MPTLTNDSRPSAAADDASRAHLFVAFTCSRPEQGASRHRIDDVDEVHIGRGAARLTQRTRDAGRSMLRLAIADDRISTAHARLSRTEGGWLFEDVGSKNGSLVNGAPAKSKRLAEGDLLQLGHTFFFVGTAIRTPPSAQIDLAIAGARTSAFTTLLPALARDFEALAAVAPTEIPILLVSETGTGKEVLTRAIHALARRSGAFVAVNCGALTTTLAESILFGHKRGAFSGATTDNVGLIRSADDGTLLLDELGDMPLALQPTLLRALQEGEVLPLGATAPVRHRARFVGATHRDLEKLVAQGTFREDLLARLAGFVFRLPPLRERREDIGLLASALLAKAGEGARTPTLSPEASALLFRYAWPRNVRELEKCLSRAAVFAGDAPIEPRHLPSEIVTGAKSAAPVAPKKGTHAARDDASPARLVELLTIHKGNLQAVADALHTSRSQVHRWLRRFAIDADDYR